MGKTATIDGVEYDLVPKRLDHLRLVPGSEYGKKELAIFVMHAGNGFNFQYESEGRILATFPVSWEHADAVCAFLTAAIATKDAARTQKWKTEDDE